MQQPTNRALIPVEQIGRWAIYGGIAAGDVALAAMALSMSAWYGLGLVTAAAATAGGVGALAFAILAFFMKARRKPLDQVERDLEKAVAMQERGLIDEDDYRRLKSQILEAHRPRPYGAPPILRMALLGGAIGAGIPLLLMAVDVMSFLPAVGIAFGAAVAGATVGGGSSVGVNLLIERNQSLQLPAPTNRRLLDK